MSLVLTQIPSNGVVDTKIEGFWTSPTVSKGPCTPAYKCRHVQVVVTVVPLRDICIHTLMESNGCPTTTPHMPAMYPAPRLCSVNDRVVVVMVVVVVVVAADVVVHVVVDVDDRFLCNVCVAVAATVRRRCKSSDSTTLRDSSISMT